MKKILITTLLAVMALAATSCSNEPDPTPNANKAPIAFGDVATRAAVTSADEILSFGVFAQMNLGNEATQEEGYDQYINLLENEEVSRATASEEWDYDNTRYWVDNRVFHFFGVYPFGTPATTATLTQGSNSYDGFKVTFSTPEAADTDLMTVHKTEKTIAGNSYPGKVAMSFEHKLANVCFEITQNFEKDETNEIRVTKVSLNNVRNKGVFSTSRFADFTDSWSLDGTVQSYVWENSSTNPFAVGTTIKPWGKTYFDQNANDYVDLGLLLIPQSTHASFPIGFTVEYEIRKKDTDDAWVTKTATIQSLPANWKGGTTVTYKLQLYEESYIVVKLVDVSILPWGVSNSGGTIIIK